MNWTLSVDPVTNAIRIDPPGAGGVSGPTQTIGGTVAMAPVAAVPESSTFALLATGFAALVARRRRRAT